MRGKLIKQQEAQSSFIGMAASDHDGPIITAGPLIDGKESIVLLLSPTQLESYPQRDALLDLINKGFAKTHQPIWTEELTRFKSPTEVVNELVPEFFTYVISSKYPADSGQATVYATASARRLVAQSTYDEGAEGNAFKRLVKELPRDVDIWELKLLVVDLSLRKTGLASLLQDLLEAEIRKRSIEAKMEDTVMQSNGPAIGAAIEQSKPIKEIRLTLTTCQEVNEAYYLRKGYTTTRLKPFPAGYLGSALPFHVAEMEKTI